MARYSPFWKSEFQGWLDEYATAFSAVHKCDRRAFGWRRADRGGGEIAYELRLGWWAERRPDGTWSEHPVVGGRTSRDLPVRYSALIFSSLDPATERSRDRSEDRVRVVCVRRIGRSVAFHRWRWNMRVEGLKGNLRDNLAGLLSAAVGGRLRDWAATPEAALSAPLGGGA
jgi:hypothetical protein